tara:strand:- start:1180 stop:1536 length:357 start_codon:yes stop_codon:yes gene_type:complete
VKLKSKNPPREYNVGIKKDITIKDCGTISLSDNEQVTFITKSDAEYDICKKSWGFYATPSVNSRLIKFNFKTALVKNSKDQVYIMIVEKDKLQEFFKYLENDKNELIEWLDEKWIMKK